MSRDARDLTDGFDIAGIVRRGAAERPRDVMLRLGDRVVTWEEHDRRSSRVARALAAAGVGPQDRVAFLGKNSVEWFEVMFGGAKLNATHVAVNWRLAPHEIAHILGDAGVKVLFVGAEFVGELGPIQAALDNPLVIVILSDGDEQEHPALEFWLEGHPETDPGLECERGDVALLLYTSGTTGTPKGAMLTYENLNALRGLAGALGVGEDTINLVAMPIFHIAGSGWALLALDAGGYDVVLPEVSAEAILDVVERHRVTHALLVPTVISSLLQEPNVENRDLSSLQTLAYGSSPISETVLRQALETLDCGLTQLYGLTETTGAITILRQEDHDPERPRLLTSCGRPLPGVELRVVTPGTTEDAAPGDVGELWVRSSQVMAGYWRNPEATSGVLTSDRWFRTGDAGVVDADGYVYLRDRLKDIIVSGGENIAPGEVENVLMAHSGVTDAAVIGVPHAKWGETPKAIVVRGSDSTVDEHDLIEFVRERLAHYKCPTSVDFVDALPRNPSGKVLKRELRDLYWGEAARRIA